MDPGIVVLGIPIPSSSPLFLGIVAVHVAAGLVCSGAGIEAMVAPKRAGPHPVAGATYYWSLVVVFVTMTALSIMRWPHNTHLSRSASSRSRRGISAEGPSVTAGVGGCQCT